MKLFFDFLPIIVFFLLYKFADIYIATLGAMFMTGMQVLWSWQRHRHIPPVLWINLASIMLLGSATLLLRDEMFIKWKPSIVYWLMASALYISQKVFKKNFIQTLMSAHIALPEKKWSALNQIWCWFFLALGGINLYIANYYSTDIWVNFKLFGTTLILIVFLLLQGFWLARHGAKHE